jgi:thioredoxin-related protein
MQFSRARAVLSALLVVGFVTPVAGPVLAQKGRSTSESASDGVAWTGWDKGLEQAARTGRPIVVDFYTDWCGWCKRMDRETYSQSEVRAYLGRRYVAVKLNPETSRENRAVANRFRVSGYPTTVFLRSNGEHLVTVPGYVPSERFHTLLRYVAEGHFEKQVPFETFRRQAEATP